MQSYLFSLLVLAFPVLTFALCVSTYYILLTTYNFFFWGCILDYSLQLLSGLFAATPPQNRSTNLQRGIRFNPAALLEVEYC
jgi:hypothetical protein